MSVKTQAQLKALLATAQTVEEQDTIDLVDSLAHVNDQRIPTFVRMTSNQATTSTSLANVTELTFAAEANKDYYVEANILATAAATTTGIFLSINGPASPTAVAGEVTTINTSGSAVGSLVNAYDGGSAAANANSGTNYIRAKFLVRNGANAGNITMRFATEVGASAVTFLAGSFIKYWKLN